MVVASGSESRLCFFPSNDDNHERLYNVTRRQLGRITLIFLQSRNLLFQPCNSFFERLYFDSLFFNQQVFCIHASFVTCCLEKRKLPILTFWKGFQKFLCTVTIFLCAFLFCAYFFAIRRCYPRVALISNSLWSLLCRLRTGPNQNRRVCRRLRF